MDTYQKTIIEDANAKYFGVEAELLIENAGKEVAKKLINKYGKESSFSFICGLGNAGAIGFVASKYMIEMGLDKITVYLIGRQNDIKTTIASAKWSEMKDAGVNYKQDAYGKDIVKNDIFIECLVNEPVEGKLFKRFRDVVYRITRLKSKIVAIESPVPGYNWDYSISLMYPKTKDADVVNTGIPDYVLNQIGPGEVKLLEKRKSSSYKTKNGKVLVISNGSDGISELFESALTYAGELYYYDPTGTQGSFSSVNVVSHEEINSIVNEVDSILIGPDLEDNYINYSFINTFLEEFKDKRFLVSSKSINLLKSQVLLSVDEITLYLDRSELGYLFKDDVPSQDKLQGLLKRYSVEKSVNIWLDSSTSIFYGKDKSYKLHKPQSGYSMGRKQQFIKLGLCLAFLSKNSSWISMCSASFVSDISYQLATKEGNANQINYISEAIKLCREF